MDKDYVALVKDVIKESVNKYSYLDDKGLMWDLIKSEIRSKTISYSAWRTKNRRKELTNYQMSWSN